MLSQLLEGIGAISTTEAKKVMSRSRNYQDLVTALLSWTFNNDAVGRDDEDEQDKVSLELNRSRSILSAIKKAGTNIQYCIYIR